jgi:GGDEF domain-containing protein
MNQNFLSETEAAIMKDDAAAWHRFLNVLDWVLAVQARYATSLRQSLVCISFHDQKTLGDAYGAKDALQMVIELAAKLRKALRKADLVARNGTDIWVLIPFVTPKSVMTRVAQIVEIAAANGLNIVDRDISVYGIPDTDALATLSFDGAEEFLEVVASDKRVAMRWPGVGRRPD